MPMAFIAPFAPTTSTCKLSARRSQLRGNQVLSIHEKIDLVGGGEDQQPGLVNLGSAESNVLKDGAWCADQASA